MKLTEENRSTRGKTCPSANLSTTNPTWTEPGSNTGLRGGRPAANRLSYGHKEQWLNAEDSKMLKDSTLKFCHKPCVDCSWIDQQHSQRRWSITSSDMMSQQQVAGGYPRDRHTLFEGPVISPFMILTTNHPLISPILVLPSVFYVTLSAWCSTFSSTSAHTSQSSLRIRKKKDVYLWIVHISQRTHTPKL
jgi:hypothetical protein